MKRRNYDKSNPCYKEKIQYHLNRVNELVNCAHSEMDPIALKKHSISLDHFVSKQAQIQSKKLIEELSQVCNPRED